MVERRVEIAKGDEGRTPALAAIDLGTNSVLLSVVRPARHEAGGFVSLHEEARVTRLGEGVDETGSLSSAAMERTFACLEDYVRRARELGATSICIGGTSALRDAENGPVFKNRLENSLSVPVEIISGDREAELTFAGALSGISVSGRLFVFDIGGGSTEFIVGSPESASVIESKKSLNVGSVRMFERLRPSDPMSENEIANLEARFRMELDALGPRRALGEIAFVVGVAGTVTSLAALALGLSSYERSRVHGASIPTAALRDKVSELARLRVSERRALTALESGRADVIVVGGLWLLAILDWLGVPEVIASDRGVRFGLLAEMSR